MHLLDIRQDGWHVGDGSQFIYMQRSVPFVIFLFLITGYCKLQQKKKKKRNIQLTCIFSYTHRTHKHTHLHTHPWKHAHKLTHNQMDLMMKPLLLQLFILMYSPWWQQWFIYMIHSYTEAIAHHLINIQWHKHLILHKLTQILHLLPTFPQGNICSSELVKVEDHANAVNASVLLQIAALKITAQREC